MMAKKISDVLIAALIAKAAIGLSVVGAFAFHQAVLARENRTAPAARHVAIIGDLSAKHARDMAVATAVRSLRGTHAEMAVHDLMGEPDPLGTARRLVYRSRSPLIMVAVGVLEGPALDELVRLADIGGHYLIYGAPLREREAQHVAFLGGKTAIWPVRKRR